MEIDGGPFGGLRHKGKLDLLRIKYALVIPAVRDRVLHRALSNLLTPHIEPTLSPACRAFRKGFSAVRAAEDVGNWVESGTPWVLRADVKKFFDNIRPEVLRAKLEPFVDADGLQFLERVLRYRVLDHHRVSDMVVGIAQGSPLSPLLGNLYLNEVDHALLAEYSQVVRYCDDLLVLTRNEAEANAAATRLATLLKPLGLELNSTKTHICRAEDGFVFLGYHFSATGRGPAVKADEALQWRLGELARAEDFDAREVDALYRGWKAYFGHHPDCWSRSLVGALALLRAGDADSIPDLAVGRWQKPFDATPALALALAAAWNENGHPEHAWLELAMACGGSRASATALSPWADVFARSVKTLGEVARRSVGAPGDRLTALADAVAELGAYEVALRLASLGTELVFEQQDPSATAAGPATEELLGLATEADLEMLIEFFQGREGIHAMESVGPSGHRVFSKVEAPLDTELWRAHLAAEKTLALPMVRTGNTALLGVLDVDIAKKALADQPGGRRPLLARALATALRLRRELEHRGAATLLELSGAKGYHLWVRLAEPVSCFQLRRWLLAVVRAASPLPEGIRVEEFPNRDRIRPEATGPVIKLPLGVHGKTGRRCHLLDEHGEPLADPFEAIRALPHTAPQVITEKAREASAAVPEVTTPAFGPRVRKILDGCRVLAHLARHAEATSYLNHRERTTLLCTLGHLGQEGAEALHVLIGHTYNYRAEVTTRHIGRLPSGGRSRAALYLEGVKWCHAF